MNLISKLPGPLLIFLGAFCLSFGGLIVKSFEGSTLWQILFWRQVFFIITVTIFLFFNYKKNVSSKIYLSGRKPFSLLNTKLSESFFSDLELVRAV